MVATVACRYFPSAKRRSPVFTWQFRFRFRQCLLLQPPPTPPCVVIVGLSPLPE